MKTLLVVLAMVAAGRAAALDPWTAGDTQREALFASVVALDLTLTSIGLERGEQERNPLLGRRPSHARLWLTGTGAVLSHVIVARLLPRDVRDAWQAFGISLEIAVSTRNAAILVGGSF